MLLYYFVFLLLVFFKCLRVFEKLDTEIQSPWFHPKKTMQQFFRWLSQMKIFPFSYFLFLLQSFFDVQYSIQNKIKKSLQVSTFFINVIYKVMLFQSCYGDLTWFEFFFDFRLLLNRFWFWPQYKAFGKKIHSKMQKLIATTEGS